jgi:hypothetical protein
MKVLLGCLAIFLGQLITLQEKPIVRLPPGGDDISIDCGGKVLELVNTPAIVHLPTIPPKVDSSNSPWSVDVKNLGPGAVNVTAGHQFNIRIDVGQTVHIRSTGSGYSLH